MFYKIADFLPEWDEEYKLTLKALNALTDESLKQPIADDRRTLGQIAWHLPKSLRYMGSLGLTLPGQTGDSVPVSAAAIAEEYASVGLKLREAVAAQWSDEDLLASQEIMGKPYTNGASLRFTLMHQAHHRGQMTVLMKQAGLKVPGLYGPSYDDWLASGSDPLP